MAGRPKSWSLYRTKNDSNWRVHIPGRGIVPLNTTDKFLAQIEVDKLKQTKEPSFTKPIMEVVSGGEAVDTNPLRAALNKMAADKAETQGAATDQPKPSEEKPTDQTAPQPRKTLAERLKLGQKDKIISVIAKAASRFNALVVELGYNLLHRRLKDDVIVTDEDLEVLRVGFDMWLQDVFDSLDPKPWHVVLVGNLLLIATMYPNTVAKPKKAKKGETPPDTNDGTIQTDG